MTFQAAARFVDEAGVHVQPVGTPGDEHSDHRALHIRVLVGVGQDHIESGGLRQSR